MPGVVKAYELRGTARKALGNLAGALADFNEAIKLAPSAVMPYNYRAGVHYARQNYAAAVRDHMEALEARPAARRHVQPARLGVEHLPGPGRPQRPAAPASAPPAPAN